MNQFEQNYKALVAAVSATPTIRPTRAGNTKSVFGTTLIVPDLVDGFFPLITSRRMYYAGIVGEMAAFLKGPKHITDFTSRGCNYWSDWGDEAGNINVDYGNIWRDFEGVDQIESVIQSLKEDPNGRRHIITAWHPAHIDDLSLPCCHWAYQFYVNGNYLELIWIQRSVDLMIGLPADIVLGALLLILMANRIGKLPGKMVFQMGDTHIYESHFDKVDKYLKAPTHDLPLYALESNIDNFKSTDFKLINYSHEDPISFKLETGL